MSKEQDDVLPPNWSADRLDEIRRLLDEGKWPAGGDELLADMLRHGDAPAAEELREMLSIVVDDALQGIDVSQRYPAFYQLMIRNEPLHRAFIESLEIFGESAEPDWDPLPLPPSEDISFIRAALADPAVTQIEPDHWLLRWHRPVAELRRLLTGTGFAAVYRDEPDFWGDENDWRTLLHSEAVVGELRLDVLLETRQPTEDDQSVPFALSVMRTEQGAPWPKLTATVTWGSYKESVPLAEEGRTLLPELPVAAIFGENGASFWAGLDLTLDVSLM